MNIRINQMERIERYLRSNMSDEERFVFEKELAEDKNLFNQYQELFYLSRSIKKFNQAIDLRGILEEEERQYESSSQHFDKTEIDSELLIIEKELEGLSVSEDNLSKNLRLNKKISNIFSEYFNIKNIITQRIMIGVLVAASIVAVLIIPYKQSIATSGFNFAPPSLNIEIYRSSSNQLLNTAILHYNKNDYKAASLTLEQAEKNIKSELLSMGESDSEVIIKNLLFDELYKIQWYQALTYMKDKKIIKAKRRLRSISLSQGPYADSASFVLENIY